MAKEQLEIIVNTANFPYELKCSPIKGIIKLHSNDKENIIITRYSVPVTKSAGEAFNGKDCADGTFKLDKTHKTYQFWKQYLDYQYEILKKKQRN